VNNQKKFYISKLFLALIALIFLISQQKAFADRKSGPERITECNSDGTLKDFLVTYPPGVIFRDMEFDLSNPTCQGVALQAYISVKGTIIAVDKACNKNTSIPNPFPTPAHDFMVIAKSLPKIRQPECYPAYLGFAGTFANSMIIWTTIYLIAFDTYKNVRVCGHDWYGLDTENYTNDKIGTYQENVNKEGSNGSYDNNQSYRESFHRGKEFSDRAVGEETCIDPKTNQPQKYYFRGLQQADYLCEKYNPSSNESSKFEEYKKAYNCCLRRRQNYICLEKNSPMKDHIFCRAGQKCSFPTNSTISFEAYKRENNRLICAKSYSLCPFNFSIAGGTVYPDFFKDGIMTPDGIYRPFKGLENADGTTETKCNEKSEIRNSDCTLNQKKVGKIKNYCQYYTHCTVVSPISYKPDFKNLSPYFSKACLDSVGDSQNTQSNASTISYDPGLGLGSQNTFSAPIVQCVKETMENIFKNIAGHSKCVDGSYGNRNNICEDESYRDITPTGSLKWKKGNKVKEVSLFEILQSRLKNIITIFLVLSVTFLGAKILILKVDISNKKEILTYLLKIGLVIYFVNGNAWKDIFFDGIYRGSSEISRIFFKINAVEDGKFKNDKEDTTGYKCNFGSLFNESGEKVGTSRSYPAGKDYLMVWDTLDCKIMQYLNYGPSFDSGTIFALIIASFFTGGIGLTLAFAIFILAFSLIATVIRAMHIFISSAIAIIIYVFVSPIIIPLILFEKTKGIFDAWLTHLISFTLQPIVLFSFLAIFITLSEKILYKDAIFENGNLVCQEHCRDSSDTIITDLNKCKGTSDAGKFTAIINPTELTPACILRFNDFKKNNAFAMLGIYLPEIFKLNNNKILLILKSALFLYVLLQMIDQIPGITTGLTGQNIDVKSTGGFEMLKKFTTGVRAIQKRAARAVQKQIPDGKKDEEKENKDEATDSAQSSEKGNKSEPTNDSAGDSR